MGGIRVEYWYDGLVLICDPTTAAQMGWLAPAGLAVGGSGVVSVAGWVSVIN